MADDPTTTRARALRLAASSGMLPSDLGIAPVLRRDVKLELEGRFEVAMYGGWVFVVFFYGIPETAIETRVPLDRFESEDEARAWALETADGFAQNWGQMMGFETARHFNNIGRFTLYKMGRSPFTSLEEVIAAQVKQLERNLREWFHLPTGRGHPSKWKAHELAAALVEMLAAHPAYTWNELSEELKRADPERAPASGEALRQLARRFGLGLRPLKRDAAKRRVKSPTTEQEI